ncbi:phosphatase PAP2 family protein [Paenibacillus sp. L3-i20]|uniref:phosphatase PAP2 family protein n=1 Tax=Paenibacillus sp. L3-i20 TaxID=2905833 RepID=UPI001EE0A66B|nr:phosphatase PAP2 family protein [Paenibacillus sp. L3-i20]GKU80073.1 hypothetical protein L3i20_v244700 [Paenibacillus sp. L3-i20]
MVLKQIRKPTILLLLLWAVLMIIFSFADLSFSKAVYDETNSSYGAFFEKFGAFPAYLLLFVSGSILFHTARYGQSAQLLLIRLVSGLSTMMGGFAIIHKVLAGLFDLSPRMYIVVCFIGTVVVLLVFQWLLHFVPIQKLEAYNRVAWACMIIVIAEMVIVNVLKMGWGRMRFRNLGDDHSQFTHWFLPQGFREPTSQIYKSFPSAHSANGWAMVAWMLYMPIKTKWRNVMLVMAIAWGLLTSYSRIVMGDHFATDVLFGGFVTICCTIVICKIVKVDLYPDSTLLEKK